jgi:hypothetical protein
VCVCAALLRTREPREAGGTPPRLGFAAGPDQPPPPRRARAALTTIPSSLHLIRYPASQIEQQIEQVVCIFRCCKVISPFSQLLDLDVVVLWVPFYS